MDEMTRPDVATEKTPKKKKRSRKSSDRGEYVVESKAEKLAAEREKREYFRYLEEEALQEHLYMATLMKEFQNDHEGGDLVKPKNKKPKKKRKIESPKQKNNDKRRTQDDDDEIEIVKVTPAPIVLDDPVQVVEKPVNNTKLAAVARTPTLPRGYTQFRLPVVKKSYSQEYIPFELLEEEYKFLIADTARPKCPGHAAALEASVYPSAPVPDDNEKALCKGCHSMLFLRHCGQLLMDRHAKKNM
ncbi:hypothetical protein LEN26_006374 [Aphanomyces euteiches]|nr:hypothetical protein AeMF1_003221 [Aphanomyces euteiches]KAH9135682.1 hypothetical protein LEN26_006374 [Aphanomyces euteiches]KAH9193613.1 hypothetical protein AeNC1_004415 [Aphanomyces euteiches]